MERKSRFICIALMNNPVSMMNSMSLVSGLFRFWAIPKILFDWKRAVDLADKVTIKHYYHNYSSWMGDSIITYANNKGKRLWVHCYISQGGELNDVIFNTMYANSFG